MTSQRSVISSGQECQSKKTGQTVLKTSKNSHQKTPHLSKFEMNVGFLTLSCISSMKLGKWLNFLHTQLFPISKGSWIPLQNGYENVANSTESVFEIWKRSLNNTHKLYLQTYNMGHFSL